MGLIRAGYTKLTPMDDDKPTPYLWKVLREIIKTAIENKQNLIIEGCYIPFNWAEDFDDGYLASIKYVCLIMSEDYINKNLDLIISKAYVVESRISDDIDAGELIKENKYNLEMCKQNNCRYMLISNDYAAEMEKQFVFL